MVKKIRKFNVPYTLIIFLCITAGGVSGVSLYRFNRVLYPIVLAIFSGAAGSFIIKLQQIKEKLAEGMRCEKNKLKDIINTMTDPVIMLDADYEIKILNNTCESLLGIKEISVLNKHFMDIVKDENLFGYILYSCSLHQNTEPKVICINSGGKDSYYNVLVKPIGDDIIIILRNLTHLKEIEKIKSNLISIISDEFRTPLTSLMIGISMFTNENIGYLGERQKKIIEIIQEDIEALSDLIEKLIQKSTIELNKYAFAMQQCNIASIIEECVNNLNEEAKDSGISLAYNAELNLPEINADCGQVVLVINSLLKNTLMYARSGESITISAFLASKNICISIKGSGEGIPAEYYESLFEKLADIKDNSFKIHSMGLEMAAVREIIEAHGGEIWYDSKPDFENVLTFTLPIHYR
ncbi:sensor histidine kinase YycG [Oxobacter pfennigii]|uniref:histidine kinase n=1 Tax=Oxobacter pfennigii TaxID=36849 RepID=A0A0P8YVP6_9CLOT|nr:ATP-binding protein [Oxobacter pfennigii]KPU43777.1 sensor histidine kinase YycG [Oxobacter pfennigii]